MRFETNNSKCYWEEVTFCKDENCNNPLSTTSSTVKPAINPTKMIFGKRALNKHNRDAYPFNLVINNKNPINEYIWI